jgi:integrase
VIVEPKTSKSRRTVYFPEGTTEALRQQRLLVLKWKRDYEAVWNSGGLVFCRENGEALDPTGISHKLKRALKKAGLPAIRVHDLRHTAASLHLARGENPKVVQELLGHSTITITLDTYSHVTPGIHAQAAKRMQELFID